MIGSLQVLKFLEERENKRNMSNLILSWWTGENIYSACSEKKSLTDRPQPLNGSICNCIIK